MIPESQNNFRGSCYVVTYLVDPLVIFFGFDILYPFVFRKTLSVVYSQAVYACNSCDINEYRFVLFLSFLKTFLKVMYYFDFALES